MRKFRVLLSVLLVFAIFSSFITAIAETDAIIIDNGDSGYAEESGTWVTLTTGTAYNAGNHRATINASGIGATYTPNITQSGKYEVHVWRPHISGTTNSNMLAEIKNSTETLGSVPYDLKTGSTGWYRIGVFNFTEGTDTYVRLSGTGGGMYSRYDAVKFIKADDTPVTASMVFPTTLENVSIHIQRIEILFNKEIPTSYLSGDYIKIKKNNIEIDSIEVVPNGSTGAIMLIPDGTLELDSEYVVEVSEEVKDWNEISISGERTFRFRTQVVDSDPASFQLLSDTDNTNITGRIVGKFSKNMSDSIYDKNMYVLADGNRLIPVEVQKCSQANKVVLYPCEKIVAGRTYTLGISPAISDALGSPIGGVLNFNITFETNESIVTAAFVGANYNLPVTSSIKIALSDDVMVEDVRLFSVTDGQAIDAGYTITNNIITIVPTSNLSKKTNYRVELDAFDSEGIAITNNDTFFFRTMEADAVLSDSNIENSGYSEVGSWAASGLAGFTAGSRYLPSVSTPEDHYALWQPNLEEGMYKVEFWRIAGSPNVADAQVEIKHALGTELPITMPLGDTASGWYDLGTYRFSGDGGYVKVWKTEAGNNLRVDSIRFTPITDTQPAKASSSFDDELYISFNKCMSDTVLTGATLNGIPVSLIGDGIKYKLYLEEPLANNTEYVLEISGVKDYLDIVAEDFSVTFTTPGIIASPLIYEYYDENDMRIYQKPTDGYMKVKCSITGNDENAALLVLAYSGENITLVKKHEQVLNGDTDFECVVTMSELGGDAIRVYVLSNAEEIKPLSNFSATSSIAMQEPVYAETEVNISGKVNGYVAGETVLIGIKPRTGNWIYLNNLAVGTDGVFSFTYPITDVNVSGWHDIFVNSESARTAVVKEFYHINQTAIDSVLAQLNQCTDSQGIESVLSNGYRELRIAEDAITLYEGINDKTLLNNRLIAKLPFTSDVVARNEFMNETAFEAINVYGDIHKALSVFAAIYGIDINEYNKVTEEQIFAQVFANMRPIASNVAVNDVYKAAIALTVVDQTPWGGLEAVLTSYCTELGLDLTTFTTLDATVKDTIMQNIAGNGYRRLSELQNKFSTALASAMNPQGNGSGAGSGGSSGGGSSAGNSSSSSNNASSGGGFATNIVIQSSQITDEVVYGFSDLQSVPWAKNSIHALMELGVVSGYEDRQFRPNNAVTREEFTKMLAAALKLDIPTEDVEFVDVDKEEWYYDYIKAAVNSGIVFGKGDAGFGIGENLTRQDMAVMIYRAANMMNLKLAKKVEPIDYIDAADINEYAVEAISMLQTAGIMSGTAEGIFEPGAVTTRAMAAKVIHDIISLGK